VGADRDREQDQQDEEDKVSLTKIAADLEAEVRSMPRQLSAEEVEAIKKIASLAQMAYGQVYVAQPEAHGVDFSYGDVR